jgi:hypothetical protein
MTYVLTGYAATVAGLGGYAVWVLRRARALERLRQGG